MKWLELIKHPSGNSEGWTSIQKPPKTGLTIMTLNQQHLFNESLIQLVKQYDIINRWRKLSIY